ncbi:MAG: NAD-dependent protein deacetylase [Xanthomonadales bacterium]|nr:NAD-dependent protein deacetylase [Xanthomonadales bacterium]
MPTPGLSNIEPLLDAVRAHAPLVVLTGAGLSAASGIPTYRNDRGEWLRSDPIQHQGFVSRPEQRQRYWARSLAGWQPVQRATPNAAHRALADLEALGFVELLVTQNVDRLHQRAGSHRVVDLHGRLDRVVCRGCGANIDRSRFQRELLERNPGVAGTAAAPRPDGDADVPDAQVAGFDVPDCRTCGGMLMPDVVFFGGTVPRERVERVQSAIDRAGALLVVGSSLMVYSGFRFCRQVVEARKPLLIVNRGDTRADDLATLKLPADGAEVLCALRNRLRAAPPVRPKRTGSAEAAT